jgi:hypothetical protein
MARDRGWLPVKEILENLIPVNVAVEIVPE